MSDTIQPPDLSQRRARLSPQQRRLLDKRLQAGAAGQVTVKNIERRDPTERIPLTYAQRSLWLTWKLDPGSAAYNMPGALHLRGPLDPVALTSTIQALIERHETLRTIYSDGADDGPEQHILVAAPVSLTVVDLRDVPEGLRQVQMRSHLQSFAQLPFRLDAEPAFRVALYQLAHDHHVLALALHHIAGDGWSIRILIEEFIALYTARCRGTPPSVAPLPIQFADYALWQRKRRDGVQRAQLDHWRTKLDAEAAPLELPFDRPRSGGQNPAEGRYTFHLPKDLSEQLRALQRTHKVSLFVVKLALLNLLLYRFSGQRDLHIGTPLANRHRAETHGIVGYLLNVQVLRTQIDPRRGFVDLLSQVRETVLDAHAHHEVPFDTLVEALQPERRPGVHPLFQVKCTQIEDLPETYEAADLTVHLEELSSGYAHFDLSYDFTDTSEGIRGVFAYAEALFDARTVTRFAQALQALAEQVVADGARPLASLTLPHTVPLLNGPCSELPATDVMIQWSRAVERFPLRLAIRYEDQYLSYEQLASHVQRLAGELIERGVGPEVRVGIHAERSCEFVLGVLAVLRANGTYVPLDAQLPAERLAFQLADSGAQLLLAARTPSWQPAVPVLPLTFETNAPPQPATQTTAAHPEQAAYVIYTSGSTGQPKGVPVSRGALSSYVQAVLDRLQLPDEAESMAMVSTVAADLGHTTFFGALCSGRSLHLIGRERAFDPDRFAAYMAEHRVDVLKIVPGHLQALLQAAQAADVLPRHMLILGGEATHWALVDRVSALRPVCRLINHYGPTETTVGVLTQSADTADRKAGTLPVGQPLANVQTLLLDPELNPVPQGVAGEICLAGAGIARGYHGCAGLTAERFVAHPHWPGARMYRTGDRARLRADGSLEFLGRVDDQVKIRGYRVEIGEVRAALATQAGVREAAVIANQNEEGRMQLHAYAVPLSGVQLDAMELRRAMAATLPDYMQPAVIVVLETLPLTPNGKLDRRALLAAVPAADQRESSSYVPPQSPVEELLASIWADVLRVSRVGRHDNFFELGGDSILTLRVVARARKAGLQLLPKQLMELQSIARIAAALSDAQVVAVSPEPQGARTGAPVLTPVQRWFFEQPLPSRHHWNQSVLLAVDGPLDDARMRLALQRLVEQHDALRLRFLETSSGDWTAELRAEAERSWRFDSVDLPDATDLDAAIERTADAAQRSLSLAEGPLFAAVWLRLPAAQRDRLLLIAHHLVIDVVSWRVLIEELQTLYDKSPQDAQVPHSTTCFTQWSLRLQEYAQSRRCLDQLPYWQSADEPDAPWPVRIAAEASAQNTVASMRSVQVALSTTQTEQLLRHSPRAYRTSVEELLLSALTQCLCRWTGLDSVRIELEAHGREDLFEGFDLSRAVGWFTSLYPVRLKAGADVRGTLLGVKEQIRQVPDRGTGYGALRYLSENGKTLAGSQPYLTFNYLGQIDERRGSAGAWGLVEEPRGQERAPEGTRRAWFEVIAKAQNARLVVDWYYSEALHDAETIDALVRAYVEALSEHIDHCMQDDAGGLSPSDVPLAKLTQSQLDSLRLDARRIEHVYPLAPMQQGLLLHTLLNTGAGMYLMQDHYRFAADIDVKAFTHAWDSVVRRHEALRTAFVWHGEETQLQVVYRQVPSVVEFFDWRALGESEALRRLEQLLQEELRQGFDLTRPPLMKLRLVWLGEQDFYLVQSFHHILMDAWCRSLLLADFFAHYEAYRTNSLVQRALPRPYRHFIGWLQQQDREAARRYWREQLQGFESPTPLPFRKERAGEQAQAEVADHTEHLSVADTEALHRLAQQRRLTVNTIVQGAWALLLARFSGLSEVLFGVTVAGRPPELEGIQDTVGLFINTIPLRVPAPHPQTPVASFLQTLLSNNLTMRQHEHLPLVEIQALSGIARGRSLFDSLFVFENAPLDEDVQTQAQALGIRVVTNRTHTNYPLTVVVIPGRRLWLQLSCDTRAFDRPDVARLLRYFKQLLVHIGANPDATVGELSCLTAAERAALLNPGIGPDVAYPFERGYADLFEEQVRLHGERPAVRASGQVMSYAALNASANRVAWGLREHGVRQGDIVALWAERGLSLPRLILGSLKLGAAYLALDATLPAQRIAAMLDAGRARVVLAIATNAESIEVIKAILTQMADPPRLLIDTELQLDSQGEGNPGSAVHPDEAAYVIYTSGSTGEPKGVVVTQRGMLNNQLSKIPYLGLRCDDVIAQTASQSFDISVWQLLAGLLCGACIEIVPDAVARDPSALLEHARSSGITVLQSVPALIRAMLAGAAQPLPALRWMLPTGEASTLEMAARWFERYPTVPLVNAYGPAECSDDVALHRSSSAEKAMGHYLPIGRATDNTRLYVLDENLEPLPAGMCGELFVAGVGVGRGYLHRPGLTAERFIPDPFAANPGERLYRTGDLARFRPNGVLEYVGRADQQVKIRGFRIEPGEIEAQIGRLPQVEAAAVHVHSDALGTAQLVGYVVPRGANVSELQVSGQWRDDLRAHLRQVLPEYMVPALWVPLERLPLTPNGKLDRKALPAPGELPVQKLYEPPQGEAEETVAAVWAEVLGVARVGRLDHFFEMGGHSLLAMQVIARLRTRLHAEVPLNTLFEAPTVDRFAAKVVALKQPETDETLRELDAFLDALEEA